MWCLFPCRNEPHETHKLTHTCKKCKLDKNQSKIRLQLDKQRRTVIITAADITKRCVIDTIKNYCVSLNFKHIKIGIPANWSDEHQNYLFENLVKRGFKFYNDDDDDDDDDDDTLSGDIGSFVTELVLSMGKISLLPQAIGVENKPSVPVSKVPTVTTLKVEHEPNNINDDNVKQLSTTDADKEYDSFSNYFGKLVNLEDVVSISKIDYSDGHLKIENLEFQCKFEKHKVEQKIFLRFYLSKSLSPIVFQTELPISQDVVSQKITLDFPLGEYSKEMTKTMILEQELNIWCFTMFKNDKGFPCINPAGVSNIRLGILYEASKINTIPSVNLNVKSNDQKRQQQQQQVPFFTELQLNIPYRPVYYKGLIRLIKISRFTLPDRLENQPIEGTDYRKGKALMFTKLPISEKYMESIKYFKTMKPSYGFIESIRTVAYATNGLIPAAFYFMFRLFMDSNKNKSISSHSSVEDAGSYYREVTFSKDLTIERDFCYNIIEVAVKRCSDGSMNLEQFVEGDESVVTRKFIAMVLGTALTVYSNYCEYLTDFVYVTKEGPLSMVEMFETESFDHMSGTDKYDCEDGTSFICFLVITLRNICKSVRKQSPSDNTFKDKVLLKIGGILDDYYCFGCLGGVTSESYKQGVNETKLVLDSDLLNYTTMMAHEWPLLLPRSYVYKLLKRHPIENARVIDPNDETKGKDLPVIVCESTGNLLPVAVKQEDNYVLYSDIDRTSSRFLTIVNRPFMTLSTDTSTFYREISTALSADFDWEGKHGCIEFNFTLQRSPLRGAPKNTLINTDRFSKEKYGKPPAVIVKPIVVALPEDNNSDGEDVIPFDAGQYTYGVPFINVLNQVVNGKPNLGLLMQTPISEELFNEVSKVLDNDYPIRVPPSPNNLQDNYPDLSQARTLMKALSDTLQTQKRLVDNIDNRRYFRASLFIRYSRVEDSIEELQTSLLDRISETIVKIQEESICLSHDDKKLIGGFMITIGLPID